MKKNHLIVITLIIFLFIALGAQSVYAIDLNLINSIRENEVDSAENLSLNTSNTNTTIGNTTVNDNSSYSNSTSNLPSTSVSNVTSTTDGTLTIENILNILLVVVGVLLILLGIAIMIRMNR